MEKDSWWSFVVLGSAFCIQIIIGGLCLNAGLYYIIFRRYMDLSSLEASWLCSLPTTLWFLAAPVGSSLTNKFGYRTATLVGGALMSIGVTLGYLAPNSEFLFFSHGILTGLGCGISHTCCLTAVNVYFEKHKQVAFGIVSVGNNIGFITYTQLIVMLEKAYGWRGMMLICGCIASHACAYAVAMFPVGEKNPNVNAMEKNKSSQNPGTYRSKIKTSPINFSVFESLPFMCFCGSNVLCTLSIAVFYLHLPSYSLTIGFNEADIGVMWLVNGMLNIFGKLFFSLLGLNKNISGTVTHTVALAISGVAIGIVPAFLTYTGIMVTAALKGFFASVTGCLIAIVIYSMVGNEKFADGAGLSLPFKAIGLLIAGPLAGALYTSSKSYDLSFYLSGICMIDLVRFIFSKILKIFGETEKKPHVKPFTVFYSNRWSFDMNEYANSTNKETGYYLIVKTVSGWS